MRSLAEPVPVILSKRCCSTCTAQYLQNTPVTPRRTLWQDRLLADAEENTLALGGGDRLAELRTEARKLNLIAIGRPHPQRLHRTRDAVVLGSLFPAPRRRTGADRPRSDLWFCGPASEAAECDPRHKDAADPRSGIGIASIRCLGCAGAGQRSDRVNEDVPQREVRKFQAQRSKSFCAGRCGPSEKAKRHGTLFRKTPRGRCRLRGDSPTISPTAKCIF